MTSVRPDVGIVDRLGLHRHLPAVLAELERREATSDVHVARTLEARDAGDRLYLARCALVLLEEYGQADVVAVRGMLVAAPRPRAVRPPLPQRARLPDTVVTT